MVAGGPAKLKMLVVDDDPVIVEILRVLLRQAGVEVIEVASDGAMALERAAHTPPDLVICDLNMPSMDGIQLLQAIASRDRRPNVILISGEDPRVLNAARQFAEAKGLPVLGALSKPISGERLRGLLHKYKPFTATTSQPIACTNLGRLEIMTGLSSGALHMAYQPKIELSTGALYGVEALLRWNDVQIGQIPPLDVVRAAEKTGLMNQLTLAVLDQVAVDYATLSRSGFGINCAINVSIYNLYDVQMVERMKAALSRSGVQCDHFTFEVTENHIVTDMALVLESLIRLRLSGFRISIDDYGTGASTMQMLAQLPSSELKIDRSFVAAAVTTEQGRLFLRSAVELGRGLGQTIVAEGVEIEPEHHLALTMGCHLGQGFLYAHPMSLEDFLDWAREHPIIAS